MLARIRRLLRYDEWANREACASVMQAAAAAPRAVKVMAHVLGAEWLWLGRLRREPPRVPVWPEWSEAECAAHAADLPRAWADHLSRLTESGLAESVEYVNSKGERWSSTVEDVLWHVVLHSAYHRGQVAAEVRARGGEPAYTDFIHAIRQRLIE